MRVTRFNENVIVMTGHTPEDENWLEEFSLDFRTGVEVSVTRKNGKTILWTKQQERIEFPETDFDEPHRTHHARVRGMVFLCTQRFGERLALIFGEQCPA